MEDQDQAKVEHLTDSLREWRQVLLLGDRWLKWEKDEYPMILSAVITVGFFLFWFLSPPVLSALAFAVMCVCVADYVVPRMHEFGFSIIEDWTEENEVKFKEICKNMIWFHDICLMIYEWGKVQREEKPKIFFCCAVISLLFIGFIAGAIPNLFLIYLLVMFTVLLPGLHKRGFLLQWKIFVLQYFIKMVGKIREGRLK